MEQSTNMQSVLVAEDDDEIALALQRILAYEGYKIERVRDGAAALDAVHAGSFDIVLLDVMMPFADGLTVCRRMRERGDKMPVLMLTARQELTDRVAGLDAGADDYVTKPFELEELLARMRALLRRSGGDERAVLEVGPIRLDVERRRVEVSDEAVDLTRTEFSILELLLRNADIVLERSTMYERIWGYDFGGSSRSLDVHVGYLRRKVESHGTPRMIRTVRGIGFVIESPVETS